MKFKDLHSNIKWRFGVGFLSTIASMMVTPYIAVYFSGKIGTATTGLLYILVTSSGIIGSFVGGYLSDLFGRIKVLLWSELVVALTFLIIAFLNSPWLDQPFLSALLFIVNVFAIGSSAPVTMALILDSSSPNMREDIFRINYWLNNLAIASGSLVGGFLFLNHHFLMFLIVAGTSFISVLVTKLFLKEEHHLLIHNDQESKSSKPRKRLELVRNYSFMLKDKVFLLFLLGSLLTISLEFQLTNYIGIQMSKDIGNQVLFSIGQFHLNINGISLLGILRTENTLLVVAATFLIARITKKYSIKLKLLFGAGIYSIGFSLLAYIRQPWILIALMLIGTVGELIYSPVKSKVLGDIAPDEKRSTYMAVYQITMFTAQVIGGLFIIIGTLLTSGEMTFIYLLMGTVGVLIFSRMLTILPNKQTENG